MTVPAIDRGRTLLREQGLARTVRKGARAAFGRAKHLVRAEDEYIWFSLDLNRDAADLPIPEGTSLRHVDSPAELPRLTEALGVPLETAQGYAERGYLPWVVEEDGEPLFTCYVFLTEMPVFGWTTLPPGVACLEHSHVAPKARGRRLGPSGALAAMQAAAPPAGRPLVITKIQTWNETSLKAFRRPGFRDATRMTTTRTLGRWRVRFTPVGDGVFPDELVAQLER